MKALYRISIFCAIALLTLFSGYYLIRYFYPKAEKNKESPKKVVMTSESDDKTTCDTEYIIIEQDLNENSCETFLEKIPDRYIDKTREQIISILSEEEKSPVLSEKEKGLESVNLSSFSVYRIVVIRQYRKTEESKADSGKEKKEAETKETIEYTGGYYLIAYDDHVYVYEGDMKSLYMVTEICLNDLPDQLIQEIMDKKYLKDDAALYNFLESYSS